MFHPCKPAGFRGAVSNRLLDLTMSNGLPQRVHLRTHDTPSFVLNHSLVVNVPALNVERITGEHVAQCRQSRNISRVYGQLLVPRYARVPATHRRLHGFVYDSLETDKGVTVVDFQRLFDRRMPGPSGRVYDVYPLASFCHLMHAIQEAKSGVTEAFWSYIIMVALQYWLTSNERFMVFAPDQLSSYSQRYPEYLFAIAPFTDFAFKPEHAAARVARIPADKLVWDLAREVSASDFAMWLCTQVSDFCHAQSCKSLCMKPDELANEIDNKLHRNNELFLTSRRFSRVPYQSMDEYVDALNAAVREKCDELKKEVAPYTFGICRKHWYPQQSQQRQSIKPPTIGTFARSAVYFFCHPQFAPNKPILPSIEGTSERELRGMCWWLQWWCSKSSRFQIVPSFNKYAALLQERAAREAADASTAASIAMDAASASPSEPAASARDVRADLAAANSALPPLSLGASASASADVSASASAGADTAMTDAAPKRRRKTVGPTLGASYYQCLTAWDVIDYTRLQYAVFYSGGQSPLAYLIDKGRRDPQCVQELVRHEYSPLALNAHAILWMLSHTADDAEALDARLYATAKDWFEHAPSSWRLQARAVDAVPTQNDTAAASAPASASSAGVQQQSDGKSQMLIDSMLRALTEPSEPAESRSRSDTAAASAVDPSSNTESDVRSHSSVGTTLAAFPFDCFLLGSAHPMLGKWQCMDAWLDEEASSYQVYMLMAFWFRVARSSSTRWFNLVQAIALASGDESVAYRCAFRVWCVENKHDMPACATRHDNGERVRVTSAEFKVVNAFLQDVCRAYVAEAEYVHARYTKLVEGRREPSERKCVPHLPKVHTYEQVTRVFHAAPILSEKSLQALLPRVRVPESQAHAHPSVKSDLKSLVKHVASNEWEACFGVWRRLHASGVNVEVQTRTAAAQVQVSSVAEQAVINMWMRTWYPVLSVQSMRRSPCLTYMGHLWSVGGEDAIGTFRARNRDTGWDRFLSVSDVSECDDDPAVSGLHEHMVAPASSAARRFTAEWKSQRDAADSKTHPFLRGLHMAIQRYVHSRAGKRECASFLAQPPELDANLAALVHISAQCLDPATTLADGAVGCGPGATLRRMYHQFVHDMLARPVPVAPDRYRHPVVDAVEYVRSTFIQRLKFSQCIWTDDWARAAEAIERAVFMTTFQTDMPLFQSTGVLVGRVLDRILADLSVNADAHAPLTSSLAKTKLRQSQTHPLANEVFRTFPALLR